MEHIKDFTIERFRGLRDLKMENLGQINLFVGNNNSGKTSVLEAASLFCDPLNSRRWYDIGSQRELPNTPRTLLIDRLIWLFPRENVDNHNLFLENTQIALLASGNSPITKVTATYEKFTEIVRGLTFNSPKTEELAEEREVEEREVEIEGIKVPVSVLMKHTQPTLFNLETALQETLTFSDYRSSSTLTRRQQIPTLPCQMVHPFSHRTSSLTLQLWSEVVEANLKEETINLLHHFDPAIQDVDFISPKERKQLISVKHEKLGRAPLYTFGDGLRRVFTLAVTIPRARGGLLLIDELETSIHTKALEKTFDWLVNACIDNNIQLFATTHSLEALDAILEVSRERTDLVVYRLQQDKEQTTATRLGKEMTLRLREELGMELRY
ncbi:MAG: AAA family ATPase [Ktedonobacteraceae bacterium]